MWSTGLVVGRICLRNSDHNPQMAKMDAYERFGLSEPCETRAYSWVRPLAWTTPGLGEGSGHKGHRDDHLNRS